MQRRSHAQWHALFQEQSTSGEDEAAFCAAHGIGRPYFRLRRRELSDTAPSRALSAFVPVAVPRAPESAALELRLGALELRLPSAVSVCWLAELLRALQD